MNYEEYLKKKFEDNIGVTFMGISDTPSKTECLVEKIVDLEKTLASMEDRPINEQMLIDNKSLVKHLLPDLLAIREELKIMDIGGVEINFTTPIFHVSEILLGKACRRACIFSDGNTMIDIPDILQY